MGDGSEWRRLIPTILIAVGMIATVLFIVFAIGVRIWSWASEPINATAAQVVTASLQAFGTVVLLILTWHSIETARRTSEEARRQSSEESRLAREESARAAQLARQHADLVAHEQRRQHQLQILPVIALQDPRFSVLAFGLESNITFDVSNVGVGAALRVSVSLESKVIEYSLREQGQIVNLSPATSSAQTLVPTANDNNQILANQAFKDPNGWMEFAEITVTYQDVRGLSWVHTDMLCWNRDIDELGFTNPTFLIPG